LLLIRAAAHFYVRGENMSDSATKYKNPYLKGAKRLADVIAAIQFLGTYKFYKVGFDYWEKRIKSPPKSYISISKGVGPQ
jgi:hypothetical protein